MPPWSFGDTGGVHSRSDNAGTIATMLMTILKIVAGLAVLGIISMVLIAVISGLKGSARALHKPEDRNDNSGDG